MDWSKLGAYALARVEEPSTWIGLGGAVGAVASAVPSPINAYLISVAGTMCTVGAVMKEAKGAWMKSQEEVKHDLQR